MRRLQQASHFGQFARCLQAWLGGTLVYAVDAKFTEAAAQHGNHLYMEVLCFQYVSSLGNPA